MSDSVTMTSALSEAPTKPPFENMVWIPGGTFIMGSDKHYPEEAPAHEVTVEGFWMDEHTVTNEEFRKFVEATKHVTSAERAPKAEDYPGAKPELLVPASVVFNKPRQRVDLRDCYNWWIYVPGADWRHPEDRQVRSMDLQSIRSCTSLTKTSKPTPNRSEKSCQRKRNGNSPPAAD